MTPIAHRPGFGLALRFARRELRAGLRGFGVFLACLALGVAAIAGVGSVSRAMLGGLESEGQSLLGGDMDLRLTHRQASPEQLAWLEQRGDLSVSTHLRAMARGESEDARRTLVELRAVDGLYPLYGEVRLDPALPLDQALALRDGAWGAVAESRLLRRLDLQVGDRVQVGRATYELRAALEHEPDRSTQAFILGPSFMVASSSLAQTALIQPGSLAHWHYRVRLPAGTSVKAFRETVTETFPEAGWQIRDTSAAAPGTSRFIERLTLFLTLVGLTSLLVGGVAVGNSVRSYLEGKTATIATLKCLGAPGDLVFKTYLIQVLALATLAVAAGLVLGALSPYAVGLILGDSLGWGVEGAVYPGPLAIAAGFGLLTTLAFSLWPLAHAQRVPAGSLFRDLVAPLKGGIGGRAWAGILLAGAALAALAVISAADRTLALYFVAGALGAFGLFRLAGHGVVALARRAGRPRNAELRLALANLHRPGAPTGSVVMSLGLGLTVLVAIAAIEGNLAHQIRQTLPEEAPGFYFIDIQPDQAEEFDRIVNAVPGVKELRRVPMLRGRIMAVNGTASQNLEVPPEIDWVFRGDRGLTWTHQPPADTELTAGTWWPADYDGPSLVSLDTAVGEALGLGPGDRLTVNVLGRDIEVEIANLRVIDWSDLGINFVMVFSPGVLAQAPQTQIATVKATPAAEDTVEREVTDRFANVSAIRVKEALAAVAGLIANIGTALRATAAVALASGVLVLAGAIAAGHHRRVYDAVVLKVLGATRRNISRAFAIEYGLLGLVTALIAGAVGTVAAYFVITEVMSAPFVFLPGTIATTALIATAITVLSGLVGTWRALSQKAAPLLRNE